MNKYNPAYKNVSRSRAKARAPKVLSLIFGRFLYIEHDGLDYTAYLLQLYRWEWNQCGCHEYILVLRKRRKFIRYKKRQQRNVEEELEVAEGDGEVVDSCRGVERGCGVCVIKSVILLWTWCALR